MSAVAVITEFRALLKTEIEVEKVSAAQFYGPLLSRFIADCQASATADQEVETAAVEVIYRAFNALTNEIKEIATKASSNDRKPETTKLALAWLVFVHGWLVEHGLKVIPPEERARRGVIRADQIFPDWREKFGQRLDKSSSMLGGGHITLEFADNYGLPIDEVWNRFGRHGQPTVVFERWRVMYGFRSNQTKDNTEQVQLGQIWAAAVTRTTAP